MMTAIKPVATSVEGEVLSARQKKKKASTTGGSTPRPNSRGRPLRRRATAEPPLEVGLQVLWRVNLWKVKNQKIDSSRLVGGDKLAATITARSEDNKFYTLRTMPVFDKNGDVEVEEDEHTKQTRDRLLVQPVSQSARQQTRTRERARQGATLHKFSADGEYPASVGGKVIEIDEDKLGDASPAAVSKLLAMSHPIVFRGLLKQKGDLPDWTDAYLRKHVDQTDIVSVRKAKTGEETTKPIMAFLENYMTNHWYLHPPSGSGSKARNPIYQSETLKSDVAAVWEKIARTSSVVEAVQTCGANDFTGDMPECNLWLGNGPEPGGKGTTGSGSIVTKTHNDDYYTFSVALSGTKHWHLLPPHAIDPTQRQAALAYTPDTYLKGRWVHLELRPGDLFVNPPEWWHYVQSVGRSCTVNWWWEKAIFLRPSQVAIKQEVLEAGEAAGDAAAAAAAGGGGGKGGDAADGDGGGGSDGEGGGCGGDGADSSTSARPSSGAGRSSHSTMTQVPSLSLPTSAPSLPNLTDDQIRFMLFNDRSHSYHWGV
jgi:hypothetical protein